MIRKLLLCSIVALFFAVTPALASKIELSKKEVAQGSFFTITITSTTTIDEFQMRFMGRAYTTGHVDRYTQFAIIPVGVADPPVVAELTIQSDVEFVVPQKITIVAKDFPIRQEMVEKDVVSRGDRARYDRENKKLAEIYGAYTRFPFFDRTNPRFLFPIVDLVPDIAVPFGELQKVHLGGTANVVHTPHDGIDYKVEEGASVYTPLTGIVRFSDETLTTGKTVIIDHGFGLVTAYFHLFDIKVVNDMIILAGERVGHSRKSGKAHTSYLHFGVWVHNIWINPEEFIQKK